MKAFPSGTFSEPGSCFLDLGDFSRFREPLDNETLCLWPEGQEPWTRAHRLDESGTSGVFSRLRSRGSVDHNKSHRLGSISCRRSTNIYWVATRCRIVGLWEWTPQSCDVAQAGHPDSQRCEQCLCGPCHHVRPLVSRAPRLLNRRRSFLFSSHTGPWPFHDLGFWSMGEGKGEGHKWENGGRRREPSEDVVPGSSPEKSGKHNLV